MREPPQEREQPIDDRTSARGILDPAPRFGDGERALHFVRAAVRDLVVTTLVAAAGALTFAEVERDARGSGAKLRREVAIEALNLRLRLRFAAAAAAAA